MKRLDGLAALGQLPHGVVLSVGNFDGVHRGHQHILHTMRQLRNEVSAPGIAVVTFEPHPLAVLRPDQAPPRLTPPDMKQNLLADEQVDFLVVLPPTPEVLNLSAEAFWQILRDQVRPAAMVEGTTFNFGKGRQGTIDTLRRWAGESNVVLRVVEPVSVALTDMWVAPVSSSLVRWLLGHGRARDAAISLGRPYALVGEVVKGYQRGRTIGVPTANLRCEQQMIPLEGVYAARCTIDATTCPVALSIGTMPTFGPHPQQVEAHLIGFDGDLYGRTISVEILDWLREQRRFPSVEHLKQCLARDIEQVRTLANLDPAKSPFAMSA